MRQFTDSALFRKASATCKRSNRALFTLRYLLPKDAWISGLFLYHYMRGVDDLIDKKGLSKADIEKILAQRKKRLYVLFSGRITDDMDELDMALYNFIMCDPEKAMSLLPYIESLLEMMEIDSRKKKGLLFHDKLMDYCNTAGSAPLVMAISLIDGKIDKKLRENIAVQLGIGMQLTHILRDFNSDCSPDSRNGAGDIRNLTKEKVEHANKVFDKGIKYLRKASSVKLKLIFTLYSWKYLSVLKRIEMRDYNLFSNYRKVAVAEKFAAAGILFRQLGKVFL